MAGARYFELDFGQTFLLYDDKTHMEGPCPHRISRAVHVVSTSFSTPKVSDCFLGALNLGRVRFRSVFGTALFHGRPYENFNFHVFSFKPSCVLTARFVWGGLRNMSKAVQRERQRHIDTETQTLRATEAHMATCVHLHRGTKHEAIWAKGLSQRQTSTCTESSRRRDTGTWAQRVR